jgi:hypothetical protein
LPKVLSNCLLELVLEEAEDDGRWRLLVLEDTGELLAADAKEQMGRGLSRLRNLVDGIVGQRVRVLVLVTTNEPLRRLHPAVARPGRRAAKAEFEAFTPEEAAAWLGAPVRWQQRFCRGSASTPRVVDQASRISR